jgi:hypothetical protein
MGRASPAPFARGVCRAVDQAGGVIIQGFSADF